VTLFDQNSHQCDRQSQPGHDPLWAAQDGGYRDARALRGRAVQL